MKMDEVKVKIKSITKKKDVLKNDQDNLDKKIEDNEKKVQQNNLTIKFKDNDKKHLLLQLESKNLRIRELKHKLKANSVDISSKNKEFYLSEEIRYKKEITELKLAYSIKMTEIEGFKNNISELQKVGGEACCEKELSEQLDTIREQKRLQKVRVDYEYNSIKNILNEQSENLYLVYSSFKSDLKVEEWAKQAKELVYQYLQNLPGDTKPSKDVARRRRKRFRRMRRRFI